MSLVSILPLFDWFVYYSAPDRGWRSIVMTVSVCLFVYLRACLTVFFIYCVCLFPFANFFLYFSFMLCYHICWWNKVVYISLELHVRSSPIFVRVTYVARSCSGDVVIGLRYHIISYHISYIIISEIYSAPITKRT